MPDLTFLTTQNKKIKIRDLKGERLVVTFWATWCGPCMQEKDLLEKVKSDFQNDSSILFVDVSFDTNQAAWKNYLEKKSPQGLQLIAKNRMMDMHRLKISGIPHRIIVDEAGNYRVCHDLQFLEGLLKAPGDSLFRKYMEYQKQYLEIDVNKNKDQKPEHEN